MALYEDFEMSDLGTSLIRQITLSGEFQVQLLALLKKVERKSVVLRIMRGWEFEVDKKDEINVLQELDVLENTLVSIQDHLKSLRECVEKVEQERVVINEDWQPEDDKYWDE